MSHDIALNLVQVVVTSDFDDVIRSVTVRRSWSDLLRESSGTCSTFGNTRMRLIRIDHIISSSRHRHIRLADVRVVYPDL